MLYRMPDSNRSRERGLVYLCAFTWNYATIHDNRVYRQQLFEADYIFLILICYVSLSIHDVVDHLLSSFPNCYTVNCCIYSYSGGKLSFT